MSGKVYVGARGTEIRVYCASDISTAVNPTISVLKPDGTITEWPAQVDGETLVYFTQEQDLSVKGDYYFQARPNLPSWVGDGETATLKVRGRFDPS